MLNKLMIALISQLSSILEAFSLIDPIVGIAICSLLVVVAVLVFISNLATKVFTFVLDLSKNSSKKD